MTKPSEPLPQIPFERVAQFVRQVTHDVRNGLNAVDLQAAFLAEIATDPELGKEARQLREMIRNVTATLQRLSSEFHEIGTTPLECKAAFFIEDARERVARDHNGRAGIVEWKSDVGASRIAVDLDEGLNAISELVGNALKYREAEAAIAVEASVAGSALEVAFHEEKKAEPRDLRDWGVEPFLHVDGRGYGLGLFRVERAMRLMHGGVRRKFDPASGRLVTTLSFPLCNDE